VRHLTLVSFEDEPSGNLGLIFKGTEGPEIFADSSGTLLAHDLLEHQNGFGRIGCPEDELEAMGGLWQVRGRWGDMVDEDWRVWSIWSPVQTLGWELVTIARHTAEGENVHWSPRLGRYHTRRHDYDEDFMEAIDFARPKIREEVRDSEGFFDIEAFLENALHLMRRGFRKAQRRFGDDTLGIDTFRRFKEAVAQHCKNVEAPGEEYRLSYGNGRVTCTRLLCADAEW
jgi:hypothetical protein